MAEDEGRIKEILAGLTAPEKTPGLAQTLLTAIPQAISVLFSPSPAEALGAQLTQRQQQQEREKERRDRVNQLGAQLRIEDILGRAKEKRLEDAGIRAEERGETRAIAGETRAENRAVSQFNRESGFQEKMANLSFDQNKKLAEIKNQYDVENTKTQFTNTKDLENLRSSNNITEQKIAAELTFIQPLIYSKYFGGKEASALYDKVSRGEKLTIEENAKITRAYDGMRNEKYKQELSLAMARSRGTSDSPVTKGIEWAQNKASTNDLGLDANGQVQELHKDMLGGLVLPDGGSPKKFLGENEQFQYYFGFYRRIHPEVGDLFGQQPTDVPDEKAISVSIDNIINTARGEKLSDAEIAQRLSDPKVQQALRATPQQIQEAIVRNKLQPGETPLTPEQKRIKEIDKELGSKAISETPEVRRLREERIKLQEKEVAEKQKALAPATIDYLKNELSSTQAKIGSAPSITLSGGGTKKALREQVEDLKRRLRDAKASHPELVDMFKGLDLGK